MNEISQKIELFYDYVILKDKSAELYDYLLVTVSLLSILMNKMINPRNFSQINLHTILINIAT